MIKSLALLIISIFCALITTALSFNYGEENFYLLTAQILSYLWFFISLRAFLKNRIGSWLKERIAKILKFIGANLLNIKLPNIKFPTRRRTTRITLFQDERTRMRSKKRNRFRKMKWKNLKSHSERIRFIYISFLQRKINKGAVVLTSDTPNEVAEKLNAEENIALFKLYNIARYGNTDVKKEEVETVLHLKS